MSQSTPPNPVADTGHFARRIMRRCDRATLATRHRSQHRWPFPALVLVAFDYDGSPLVMISRLAEHTQNLLNDAEAGLLFDGTSTVSPVLSGPRVTLVGRVERSDHQHHRYRFLARHREAAQYAAFSDFAVYRFVVAHCHLVAGFGRVQWLNADALLLIDRMTTGFSDGEPRLLARLTNGAPLGDCFARLGASSCPSDIVVTGIDPDGVDGQAAEGLRRIEFSKPMTFSALDDGLLAHA